MVHQVDLLFPNDSVKMPVFEQFSKGYRYGLSFLESSQTPYQEAWQTPDP